MKVRLKHLQHVARSSYAGEFQFHEGPIKTVYPSILNSIFSVFQFHEGPIKTGQRIVVYERF